MRFGAPDIAVSGARHLVATCLASWGVDPETVDDARLVTSELVTNAVVHDGADTVDVEVVDLGDAVMIAVDFESESVGAAGTTALGACVTDAGGRGLEVVDALGQTWGRLTDHAGGRSWCHLAAPAAARRSAGAPTAPGRGVAVDEDAVAVLLRLSSLLSAARTPAEVGTAATTSLRTTFRTDAVALAVVDADGRTLRWHAPAWGGAVEGRTTPPAFSRRDLLPASVAVREARAVYHETRAAAEAQFPAESGREPVTTLLGADTRASAFVPLVVEGVAFGVLTLEWTAGRVIDRGDRALLDAVAAQVATAWQRATLSESYRHNAEMLQKALLPQVLPAVPGCDLGTVYRPMGVGPVVGGDWYDAFVLDDGTLRLVIGDVVGHGVEAAAVMAKIRYSARAYALSGAGASEVLTRTNRLLAHSGRNLLATMLYVEYDAFTRTALVANAGHPPALLVPPVGPATRVGTTNGPLLGVVVDAEYPVSEQHFAPGDALVMFTDGLVEVSGESVDVGIGRLAGDIRGGLRTRDDAADIAAELVARRVQRGPLADDVCALVAIQR